MSIKVNALRAEKGGSYRSLSLQRKFLLGVGVIFLGFCLIIALAIYTREKRLLEKAAYERAEIVMAAAEATRSYVQEVLRPKMYQVLGQDAFLLEAMSTSYVGRAVMDRLKDTTPDYEIRRVGLDARNPASDPKPFEIKLINFFAAHPQLQSWQGIVQIAGQSSFVHSRPVYFTADCMHCHGKPQDAPPGLIKLYGSTRGFGYKPGDIAGVTAVSISVDRRPGQDQGAGHLHLRPQSLRRSPCSMSASSSFSTGWSSTV